MRTVRAVVVGFIAWTVLFLASNSVISTMMPSYFKADGSTESTGMLLGLLALSVAYSIVSGWVAAKIAATTARAAAFWLGVFLLAVGVFVQVQNWELMPLWYHLCFLSALVPAVLVGARIARGAPH